MFINLPIVLDEYKLMLLHITIEDFRILDRYINKHGHIHDKSLDKDYPNDIYSSYKHINVSVDVTEFRPISLEEINNKR